MNDVTLDHIAAACTWAKDAAKPCAIGSEIRSYNQSGFDCGTTCCIWGAASILAGNGPAKEGPSTVWALQSARHQAVTGLLCSITSTPEQIAALVTRADLTRADLTRANLSRADLSRADLTGANLSRANLSRADLSGANLSRADLTGAYIYLGNRKCLLA